MKKVIYFYLICALILLINSQVSRHSIVALPLENEFIQMVKLRVLSNFKHKMIGNVFLSISTGLKSELNKKFIEAIRATYLWILISNNGLHTFLIINLISFFISSNFKKKFKKWAIYFNPLLINSFFFWKHILIRLLNFYLPHKFKYKKILTYLILFAILCFLSRYLFSFQSLSLGIIYWGTYYLSQNESRFTQLTYYTLTILLICIFQSSQFSFIGLVISLLVIFIFKKLYFVLLTYLIFCLIGIHLNYFENILNSIVNNFELVAKMTNLDSTNSTLLLFLIILWCLCKKSFWPIILFFILNSSETIDSR